MINFALKSASRNLSAWQQGQILLRVQWTYLVFGVDHGGVAPRAEVRVELEEFLVAQMKQVDLGVVEGGVDMLV